MQKPTPDQTAMLLTAVQVGDAVACAIPLAFIERDLVRLGCPPELRKAIPAVKAASAAGLAVGFKFKPVGRLTIMAIVAYFVCAIAAHARMRDQAWRYLGALGMTALVLSTYSAYTDD